MPQKPVSRVDRFMRFLTFPWLGSTREMWVILSWNPIGLSESAAFMTAMNCDAEIYDFLNWCIEHRDQIKKLRDEQRSAKP